MVESGDTVLSPVAYRRIPAIVWGRAIFLTVKGNYPPHLQIDVKSRRDVNDYYMRRFCRLGVPFMTISFPFYFYRDILQDIDVFRFFMEQSSLYFWFYGNNGMWYISVALVSYALFPFIYKITNDRLRNVLAIVAVTVVLLAVMRMAFPNYYAMTKIGIPKFPIFIVGCYFGYLAKNAIKCNVLKYFISVLVLAAIFYVGRSYDDTFFSSLYEIAIRLLTIPLCCMILSSCAELRGASCLNRPLQWLGRYSLELYLLHMFLYQYVFQLSNQHTPVACGVILFVATIFYVSRYIS